MQGPEVHPRKPALRAVFMHARVQEKPLRETAMELRKLNHSGHGAPVPATKPGELLPHEGLTCREMEVWMKLANGLTNAQIASALQISIETVRKHVGQILRKLGVENRASAARKASELAALEASER